MAEATLTALPRADGVVVDTEPKAHPVAKGILEGVAFVFALPFLLLYRLAVVVLPNHRERVFQDFSQLLSLWPGVSGSTVRRAFYRRTLRRCSRTCTFGFGAVFATPDVEIGERVGIGLFCNIGHATFGDDILLGSNIMILSGRHQHGTDRLDIPMRQQPGSYSRVAIASDVWIGSGAIIMADVSSGAVVSAGAVVVKPVPARSIVGGNPARVIGERGAPARADEP